MICSSTFSLMGSSGIARAWTIASSSSCSPLCCCRFRQRRGQSDQEMSSRPRIGNRRHFRFGVGWVSGGQLDRQIPAQASDGARILDPSLVQYRAHPARVEFGQAHERQQLRLIAFSCHHRAQARFEQSLRQGLQFARGKRISQRRDDLFRLFARAREGQ